MPCSATKMCPASTTINLRPSKRQGGLALVIVIWILSLLSLMAGSFALSMRRESSVASAVKNNAQAQALAESGLSIAALMLQNPDPEQRWQADGSIYRISGEEHELRIQILAESGKVDLNAAEENLLLALLNAVSADEKQRQQLLDAIIDWRDADDEPRPHGAEKKQYRQAGLPYQPANQAFQSLEELQLVQGITPEIFAQLQPWITIYSGQPQLNLKAAAPELLQMVNAEMRDRNVHDVYLENRLADQSGARDPGSEQSDTAMTDQNQTYTVMVQAQFEDRATAALEVVCKLQNLDAGQPPLQILDWKHGQQGLALFDPAKESQLITVQDEFTSDH